MDKDLKDDHMDNYMFPEDVTYPEYTGAATESVTVDGMSWSLGDLNVQTEDMFDEELRKKYPALKQAWEHYMNVKKMCEAKEKENED